MESNVYNGTKTDFSYFIRMALQDNIAWKSLAMILKDLAPTLIETREVIFILLKALEALKSTLKKKEKELKMFQNNGFHEKSQKNNVENHTIALATKNILNHTKGIKEQEQSSLFEAETETIEDEIEVLDVVKESIDGKKYLDVNKAPKSYAKNKHDWTPLHLASFHGREKIAEILLQNKANPNSTNKYQDTPLHKAAEYGHPKVVELLLNHGADKTLKNNDNRTPLQEAQRDKSQAYNQSREDDFNSVISLLEEQN